MVQLSANELQTYEALYKHQGARIEFNCDNVTYKGIIDMILPEIYQVKLRHAVIGDHYQGNLRFKFHEITSFSVIESSESVNRYPRNDYLLNILKNDQPVPNKIMAKALFGDKLSDESDDESTDDIDVEEKFVLDLPSHLINSLPKDYIQIDSVSKNFYEAIQCIGKQQVIGVSFHGPLISRFGKLSWICISSSVCSYIFDMQQLGKEAFDKGLKGIFESKSVKKVIHDSRFPSDCLAHQYATLLNNVFDTRVADFVISMQRYNDKYKFHSFTSLDSLLRMYLKVPQQFIFPRETSMSNSNTAAISSKRPISNAYLYDLLKSVVYLKLLQEKLSNELLVPFYRATGFYRTVLSKSCTKLIDFLGSDLSRPDQVPPCLIMNGIQTVYFQKPVNEEMIALKCTFINPKNGQVVTSSLGTPAAVKASFPKNRYQKAKLLLLSLKKSAVNESCVTEEINPLSSKGVSEASAVIPLLGSPAAFRASVPKHLERKKQQAQSSCLSLEKNIVSESYVTSEEMTPRFSKCASQISSNSNESDNKENKFVSLSAKSSFRHLDEVYHKLANQMTANKSDNVVSNVNVKPSVNYASTFVDKRSFASCSNKLYSSVNMSSKSSGNLCGSFEYSNNSNKTEIDENESNDIWSRLRAEIAAEKANSLSAYSGQRKITYVPG